MEDWMSQEVSDDEFDLDITFLEEEEDASKGQIEFVSCSAFSCPNERTCNTLSYCEGCA